MAQAPSNAKTADKSAKGPFEIIRYGNILAAIWRNIVDNGNASRPLYR